MFGRDLVRRSHAHCELCRASGVRLNIYEVSPIPPDPDFDSILFLCDICRKQVENPARLDAKHWHCLEVTAWSDLPVVKVMAVRLLRQLQHGEPWAEELLEQLYLDETLVSWIDAAALGE